MAVSEGGDQSLCDGPLAPNDDKEGRRALKRLRDAMPCRDKPSEDSRDCRALQNGRRAPRVLLGALRLAEGALQSKVQCIECACACQQPRRRPSVVRTGTVRPCSSRRQDGTLAVDDGVAWERPPASPPDGAGGGRGRLVLARLEPGCEGTSHARKGIVCLLECAAPSHRTPDMRIATPLRHVCTLARTNVLHVRTSTVAVGGSKVTSVSAQSPVHDPFPFPFHVQRGFYTASGCTPGWSTPQHSKHAAPFYRSRAKRTNVEDAIWRLIWSRPATCSNPQAVAGHR